MLLPENNPNSLIECTKGGEAVKRYERMLERAILGADLPGEAIPGQPLIEISGDCRVLVENHCGVSMYGRNEIHIRVAYGSIAVCGNCLELVRMSKQQLVITGKINGITLERLGR